VRIWAGRSQSPTARSNKSRAPLQVGSGAGHRHLPQLLGGVYGDRLAARIKGDAGTVTKSSAVGGASWAIALGVATEVARPAYADRAAAQAQTARPKKGPAQVEGRSGARGGQLKRAALTTVMPQDTTPVVRIWEKKSLAQKKVKRGWKVRECVR